MDSTAQNTPVPQQTRPLVEPPVRVAVPQQPIPQPVTPAVPSSVTQISIGREQGSIQINTDNEDDTIGAQQYTPVQTQAPSEVQQQHSPERIVPQAVPQEIVQQPVEVLRPANPEVAIPHEIEHVVERSVEDKAFDTSLIPPDVKPYVEHVEAAGVPVPQNDFGIKALPLSYMQAEELEKKTKYQSGAHWFADKLKYLWRKVNPTLK